jgi:hypothetical protein
VSPPHDDDPDDGAIERYAAPAGASADVKALKKGAKVRALHTILDGSADNRVADTGDVGDVVEPSTKADPWPTVRFEKGATVVFDGEVELA